MDRENTNGVAVITGGTSGIGKAIAERLADKGKGMHLVIAGRGEERGEALADAVGDQAEFVQADVRREAEVKALFEHAVSSHGRVDVLFNNAGAEGPMAPITDYPEEAFDDVVDTNLKGAYLCVKHALPPMLEQGSGTIVNTASFVGTAVPFPPGIIYGATKAALLSMTSALAEGYGEHGIRTMAVCPWMTETPMLDRLTGGQEEARAQMQQINPSGEFASAADIAEVACAMYGGSNGYENGEAYLVDAGGDTQQVQIPYPMI